MLPETRALSSGRYAGAAVAIVALAAVLRFYKLGEWSMWVDEGMTYVRAATGNLSDQGPLYATAPLNFLVTRAIISAFQPSLFWLRFFPAVCGVLGVAAILWSGSRLAGPVAGLVAGLLLALSPWHIDWSQNARHFSAVFLFMVVAVTAFFLYWESGRIRWLLASGVASALGLLTHSSSLFVLVGMGMYATILVLLRPYRTVIVTRQKLIATAAFFVILVGAYAPIALSVSQYLGAHKTAWNPPSNVAASILFYLGPLELVLAGLAGLLGAWRGRRGALLALQCLCWPVICVVVAASRTISSGAYALPALGGAVVLVGMFVSDLWTDERREVSLVLVAAVAAQLGLRTGLYFTTEQGNRPPWREAAHWVTASAASTDEIYATEGVILGYYAGDLARGRWLDHWHPPAPGRRQWLLVLSGDADVGQAPLADFFRERCQIRQVFFRNSGPKRRDVVAYACE